MNSCVEGNPCVDVVLVSIGWGENGRAALIPVSSSTSRSTLVYPHFAWHAYRQDYLLESGKQSTRTTLLCSEPAAAGILRTFLAEKRTWNVTVWHKLWLLCESLKVAIRNTFIKNSAFSENLNHSLIFFRIRLFDSYEYKWMTLNWSR